MDIKETTTNKSGQQYQRKVEMPSVDKIINAINQRGMFNQMRRYNYGYSAEDALPIIEAIGKTRNPDFVVDEHNRFAYLNFAKWVHGDPTMQAISPTTGQPIQGRLKRGIYIGGMTGSGKSWCLDIMRAYSLAMKIAILTPESEEPRNLYWQTFRADEICDEFAAQGSFQRFKKMELIGIQDLGSEPHETLYMGNRIDVMRQFIEYRGDMMAELTLITSNFKLGGDMMNNRYGDRVASRLCEMCNYLVISGKDRRKN